MHKLGILQDVCNIDNLDHMLMHLAKVSLTRNPLLVLIVVSILVTIIVGFCLCPLGQRTQASFDNDRDNDRDEDRD